jgi:hypothetical protein
MLRRLSSGLGYLAWSVLATEASAKEAGSRDPLAARVPPRPARARRVIFLWQGGGPPQMDTFDYKPQLNVHHGKPAVEFASVLGESYRGSKNKIIGTPWKFQQYGSCGKWISELFPHVAQHADDICFIHSMQSDFNDHPQASLQMHTGHGVLQRPSLGAWSVYGLGTVNRSLPGFITLGLAAKQHAQTAFMPAIFGATDIQFNGSPARPALRYLHNPQLSRAQQRRQLDFIQELNGDLLERSQRDAKVDDVIRSYELAFRVEEVMPGLLDLSKEPASIQKMYGIGERDLAAQRTPEKCLLARRLIEAGVRFVEVELAANDAHFNLKREFGQAAFRNDRPVGALLTDLKQRGLLDDTLVICGGEFGRTPHCQAAGMDGRDHNNSAFTLWLAGGGVRRGLSYGSTDEFGKNVREKPVHVHDLHATILHLLGFDHEQLTYRYSGSDYRLTDVHGKVVHDIIA